MIINRSGTEELPGPSSMLSVQTHVLGTASVVYSWSPTAVITTKCMDSYAPDNYHWLRILIISQAIIQSLSCQPISVSDRNFNIYPISHCPYQPLSLSATVLISQSVLCHYPISNLQATIQIQISNQLITIQSVMVSSLLLLPISRYTMHPYPISSILSVSVLIGRHTEILNWVVLIGHGQCQDIHICEQYILQINVSAFKLADSTIQPVSYIRLQILMNV